jgi:hypothetical protein
MDPTDCIRCMGSLKRQFFSLATIFSVLFLFFEQIIFIKNQRTIMIGKKKKNNNDRNPNYKIRELKKKMAFYLCYVPITCCLSGRGQENDS